MQINNNTNSPNFTAIRVVKVNTQQFIDFTRNNREFCRKSSIFRGESFYHFQVLKSISEIKHKHGGTWIFENAEKFGLVNLDNLGQLPMFVFTGIDKLKLSLFDMKNLFTALKLSKKAAKLVTEGKYPKHLETPLNFKLLQDEKDLAFKKFLEKNNAKHESFQEFISELCTGKI